MSILSRSPTRTRRHSRTSGARFLEEVRARRLPVRFFATIRATDIVRDRDILTLYREAGILYVLMGIESTSDDVLRQIRKGSTSREDFQACRLLREHGIFSIIGHIVGFGTEDGPAFRTAMRQLRLYDGDYVNAMYVTPHAWTRFAEEVRGREIVEPDQSRWDYRHQVLAQESLRPWQLFLAVKWLELRFHLRVGRIRSLLRDRDRFRRRQRSWVYRHVAMVWLAEVFEFLFRASFARHRVHRADEMARSEESPPTGPRSFRSSEPRARLMGLSGPATGVDGRACVGGRSRAGPRRNRSAGGAVQGRVQAMSSDEYAQQVAFPRLSDAEVEHLAGLAKVCTFRDGEEIFRAGQRGLPLYVVVSGGIAIVDESAPSRRPSSSTARASSRGMSRC